MAANDFVAIDISGEKELSLFLSKLTPAIQDAVTEDVADYMINILRLYPPQKKVTRKQAYGVTFFTDKQRRWFFWAIGTGALQLPYRRTQGQARGWKKIGSGASVIVANETPGVMFTRDNERQSRLSKLIGWKTTRQELTDRQDRIMKVAIGAANRAIKREAKQS